MAKNQADVLTAAAGYLRGKVVDNTTIVSEALNNDIVQFFVKLMSLGGISPNGLYDNETNNYQFIQALIAYVKSATFQATFTERGVAELATAIEAQAQTDNTRIITPLILAQVTSTETRVGLVEKATTAEAQAGTADKFIDSALLLPFTGGLLTKVIEIGDWNMASTTTVNIAHGLTLSKIRKVEAIIRNDSDTGRFMIENAPNVTVADTSLNVLSSEVRLDRKVGGYFDTTSFDSTSYNRGYIIIQSIP